MEAIKWKMILGEWVKKTELVDVSGSLEQLDINMFYMKFRDKIRSDDPNLQDDLNTFLKERFPAYEILYSDDKNIAPGDFMYIFSLMLYYSCVVRVDGFFQKSCEALDSKHQPVVVKFFGHLNQVSARLLTRDVIHSAIKQASPSPFHLKFIASSPRGTPDKIYPTPKKMSFNDKSKEYQRTKTQLENEKYERMMLESELKQSEEKLQQLVKEVKSLKQELQKLKQDQLMDKDNENLSPNKVIRDEQTRLRLKKEIDSRDEIIVSLKCDIDVLSSKEEKNKNRMLLMEREMKEIRQKINEADCINDEMGTELAEKNRHILMLEETNNELRSFINENRSGIPEDVSSDALDVSLSTSTTAANTSGNGENLAKCVIDVQLKEKEAENLHLKEMLAKLAYEKEVLENAMSNHNETTSELQTQLEEKSSTIATLTNQTDNVMKENKSLIEKSKHLESGIQLSGKKIEEMDAMVKTQIAECNKALQDAQKAREEFQILLESEKVNFSVLSEKYEKETLESSGAIDSLTNDMNIALNDLKEKSSEVEVLKVENLRLLEKGRKDIESLIAAKDTTLMNIESSSKAKIKDLKEATQKMEEKYRKQAQLLKDENEVAQKQVVEYKDLLKIRDEMLKQIEEEKATLQIIIQDRDQQSELSSKTNQEKQSLLEKEIDALKQQFGAESGKLLKALEKLRLSNAELLSMKSVKNENEVAQKQVVEFKAQLKTRDEMLKQIEEEKATLQIIIQDRDQQSELSFKTNQEKQSMLEKEVDALKQQFGTESEKLLKALEELRVSNAELSSIKSVKQTQDGQITKIKQENFELERMLENSKSQLNEIQTNFANELQQLEQQLDNLKTELISVNIKLEGLTAILQQKEDLVEKLTNEIQLMKQEIQDLNTLIASLRLTIEKLTSELDASKQSETEKEESLEGLKLLFSISENNLKDKEIELSKLSKELEWSMLKQTTYEESLRAAETTVESLKLNKVSLEENLVTTEAQNDTVQKHFQETIAHLESKLEQAKISMKEESVKHSNNATEAQKTLSQQHKQQIIAMEKKLSECENCRNDLTSEVENLRSSLEKTTFALTEKETLLSTLASREEKQSLEQARLEGELSGLKQTLSERELHIENIDLEMSLLAENKQSIIRAKAILENEMDAMKSVLSSKTAEADKLDSLYKQIKEKLSTTEKTVEVLRNEKEDLNERMNMERGRTTQLQNDTEDNEEMISGLQINIDELKEQNQLLQVQIKTTTVEKVETESVASELRQELAIIKKDLDLKVSQCSLKDSEHKALQEIVAHSAELKTNNDQMQIQYNLLKEQTISLESEISSKEDEISQLTVQNNCLIISLDNITDANKQKDEEHLKALREYEERNREQQVDLNTFQEKLQQSQAQIDDLTCQAEKLNTKLQEQKLAYKNEVVNFTKTIKQQEILITEKNEAISEFEKIKTESCEKIKTLELQVETTKQAKGDDVTRLATLLEKLEEYKLFEPKLKELEVAHEREKRFNNKLSQDNEVYNAKLIKTRQENDDLKTSIKDLQSKLTDIKKKSDEEVRDTRLEMEGKLEKMKERMKLLYTEEMTKKNQKNEEKLEEVRKELQSREEEIERLKITSETMKENESLKRKLRFLEINSEIQPRESIGMSRHPATTNHGNYGMEDEAGEEFNNTYLVSLQQGGSELSLDSNKPFAALELQQRNSLYPQHLRASYVTYTTDKILGEREMKDGAQAFNDSRTALIQNGANRKKQSTSYQRPGPPTPSKMGGRLSIGVASDVNYTNVLKDSSNTENVAKKTPRSFTRIFGSTKKDENQKTPRRLSFFRNKK